MSLDQQAFDLFFKQIKIAFTPERCDGNVTCEDVRWTVSTRAVLNEAILLVLTSLQTQLSLRILVHLWKRSLMRLL